jgi:hypothetical protein
VRAYLWAAGYGMTNGIDQAARKPSSLAAKLVSRGFAARVAANPLDR